MTDTKLNLILKRSISLAASAESMVTELGLFKTEMAQICQTVDTIKSNIEGKIDELEDLCST